MLIEWLRARKNIRKEMKRLKSLKRKSTCVGCGLKGPWLGIFVHPIMPEDVRGKCELADRMEPMNKMARLMTLNMMGIPLDERIMRDIEKQMFDNPTKESIDFIDIMHQMFTEAGIDMSDRNIHQQTNEPSKTEGKVPLRDDPDAWKQFD